MNINKENKQNKLVHKSPLTSPANDSHPNAFQPLYAWVHPLTM